MKREMRIIAMGEERTGVSTRSGQPWTMTNIVCEWSEHEPMAEAYTCGVVIITTQKIDRAAVQQAIDSQMLVEVRFYPSVHEFNGRHFNDVRGYLPKIFVREA